MKKMVKGIVLTVVMVSLVFGMAACSKDNPTALAKEYFDLTEQLKTVTDPLKAEELMKKYEAIVAKVEKMSEADQEAFAVEMMKYQGSLGLGGEMTLEQLEKLMEEVPDQE